MISPAKIPPADQLLLRSAFPLLQELALPLAQLFYGRLFSRTPALRPLFRGDLTLQSAKLMALLSTVLASLDDWDSLAPTLTALGQRHQSYGVQPHHYPLVADAFLWALQQALHLDIPAENDTPPPPATPEFFAAWQRTLLLLAQTMQSGLH